MKMFVLGILAAACAMAQATPDLRSTPVVPYTGANKDVDLGTFKLKAASVETTGSGPSRVDLRQGACPTTPTTGFDGTVCMEAGTLFMVTPTTKVPLAAVIQPKPQVDPIDLSTLAIPATATTVT